MRSVPPEIDEAFHSGRRSEVVPFSVNDEVEVMAGPHAGRGAAMISIESLNPTNFLVEFGDDGTSAVIGASSLRLRLSTEIEIELSRKLLERGHLNVPERAILGGRVRLSILVRLLEASLDEYPYFPPSLKPTDEYTGAVIERRGREYWVHERYESGVNRIGPVMSRRVSNSREAILVKIPGSSIDGVEVDFNA